LDDVLAGQILVDLAACLEAVHDWHVDVQDNYVEKVAGLSKDYIYGFQPVICRFHFEKVLEHVGKHVK